MLRLVVTLFTRYQGTQVHRQAFQPIQWRRKGSLTEETSNSDRGNSLQRSREEQNIVRRTVRSSNWLESRKNCKKFNMARKEELGHEGPVSLVVASDFILKSNKNFKADGIILMVAF